MSVISIFSGKFCNEKNIVVAIGKETGLKVIDDKCILENSSKLSGISEDKIRKSLSDKISIFNKFTHDREKSLAAIKLAIANLIVEQDIIFSGYIAHIIPRDVSHILRICIIIIKGKEHSL